METRNPCWRAVLVVARDGSVSLRMGELSPTSGLVVVADCPACRDAPRGGHDHHWWRIQTTFGYLVGEFGLPSRAEAHAAAAALGGLPIDWTDPALATTFDRNVHGSARSLLARWGLVRAAA